MRKGDTASAFDLDASGQKHRILLVIYSEAYSQKSLSDMILGTNQNVLASNVVYTQRPAEESRSSASQRRFVRADESQRHPLLSQ